MGITITTEQLLTTVDLFPTDTGSSNKEAGRNKVSRKKRTNITLPVALISKHKYQDVSCAKCYC